MNSFTIVPDTSWFTNPKTNGRGRGRFLSKSVQGFYHAAYRGGDDEVRRTPGTVENIITTLKNQFKDKSRSILKQAQNNLIQILELDFPEILRKTGHYNLTVCTIPRSKAELSYSYDQLLFKKGVSIISDQMKGFINGTNYLIRHTNTRTTHLNRSGYGGDGDLPYPGITKETCSISNDVKGKNILLVDDLYTATVNIDEDAIQALFDKEASSVVFYSLGRTELRSQNPF